MHFGHTHLQPSQPRKEVALEMDVRKLCNSGGRSIRFGRCIEGSDSPSGGIESNRLIWKVLWLKLKKEHKRIFVPTAYVEAPYDEFTYSQNFDQGHARDEPENLWRSFSVRYAKLPRKKSL